MASRRDFHSIQKLVWKAVLRLFPEFANRRGIKTLQISSSREEEYDDDTTVFTILNDDLGPALPTFNRYHSHRLSHET
jgi:hypothetical protein